MAFKGVDRYFKGYEKEKVLSPNGRMKTRYIYRGEYYKLILSEGKSPQKIKALSILYLILYIAATIAAGFLPVVGNIQGVGAVGLLALTGFIPALFWAGSVLEFATSRNYMVYRKYSYGILRMPKAISIVRFFAAAELFLNVFIVAYYHSRIDSVANEIIFAALIAAKLVLSNLALRDVRQIDVEEVPYELVPEEERES